MEAVVDVFGRVWAVQEDVQCTQACSSLALAVT